MAEHARTILAVKASAIEVGISETARITGLAKWTIRRIVRGMPVNTGSLWQAAGKLGLPSEDEGREK